MPNLRIVAGIHYYNTFFLSTGKQKALPGLFFRNSAIALSFHAFSLYFI